MEIPHDVINQILRTVESVQDGQKQLAEDVLSIKGRLELLALQQDHNEKEEDIGTTKNVSNTNKQSPDRLLSASTNASSLPSLQGSRQVSFNDKPAAPQRSAATSLSSRIILTTYPGQAGIDPIAMSWGHHDQMQRGPVVVSRSQSTIKRRNAIGAHGGSYSVYHALAVASKNLDVDHRADFTNSEPAVNLGPFAQWADAKKIVSLDPWGHLSPWLFDSMIKTDNIHIRPTIAITKAHMKLPELEQSVRLGRLKPDGKICLNDTGELAVTKFAVEPVWFLPGVAERFGIEEAVKEAQRGGSGVVVYFRKEGRALGEVTKYLVYNASK
ncbi:MAG: hypothetical protein L6R36_003378 [Xanthoria steineri]|nr:MAG: hypothetical protein L6R36_003378 [Xanthoria steineri]